MRSPSQRSIFLKTNDVVLDKSFIEPENIRKLCGKRRFTLAHECAHQILFQLDADDRKIACHKRPEVREKGSRVLRTQEDWNEWQANTLGAAILMPQSEVDRAMWFINSRKPLTCYGWRFYDSDQVKIDTFCGVFGVSRSAAAIRLEQLGYLNRKKDYEYRDPLEVWPLAGISEYRNRLRKCRLKSSGQRMRLLRKSPGLSGALIADTIQSSSLRIPEDMCRPNVRPADARPSSMFWK